MELSTMSTATRVADASRSARAPLRCPSHATADSLPISKATPRPITAQNAPAKMDVRPLIENAAEQVASDSAARSVTVAMLRLGVTGAVTGRGTVGVTLSV